MWEKGGRCHFGSSCSHFGSNHFCSNFFLLTRKKTILAVFLCRHPSDGEDGSVGGVGASCPRAAPKVGSVPRASKDGKPQQQPRQFGTTPTAGSLAPAAPQWPGAGRRQESGCRTPTRRQPWHKSESPSWRRHSELLGTTTTQLPASERR